MPKNLCHCKQSIIGLKYALLDILLTQKNFFLIFYDFGMKCHSLDCTTSHFETNTQYRAYFNQQQNAIFTRDVERERECECNSGEREYRLYCQCFHSSPVFFSITHVYALFHRPPLRRENTTAEMIIFWRGGSFGRG